MFFKKNKWVAKKDINNNLKIGQIYNNETASKINSGDPIISINGNKITNEEEFIKILEDKDINELKIILLDKNNKNNKKSLLNKISNFLTNDDKKE